MTWLRRKLEALLARGPELPCPSCASLTEELEIVSRAWSVTADAYEKAAASAQEERDGLAMSVGILERREPTQAEGDAHELGASPGECFVVMGGWTGRRCVHCSRWAWGGPTACPACVARVDVAVAMLGPFVDEATEEAAPKEVGALE